MKILLVHKFFHITGGAEVFFFETARVLKNNGHELAYFSTKNKLNKKTKYEKYFVEPPKFDLASIGKMIYSKEAKKKFAKLLDDFKPDIVHVFGIFTHISPSILEAAKERKIPVVMSGNDYKHICPNYKLFHHGELCEKCRGGKFYEAVLNCCCHNSIIYSAASALEAYVQEGFNMVRKNVDIFLFSSDFIAHKTEEFWGKNNFKWRKMINQIETKLIEVKTVKSDYVLYLGRLTEEKGVEKLITTMKNMPNVRLKIAGDGPEKNKLKKMATNNVQFLGWKNGEEKDKLIRESRMVVVPSEWYENFPNVIIEAFMLGKTVVASNRGGIPEMVKSRRFGTLYNPDEEMALEKAIKFLWKRPLLTKKMGFAARKYVIEEFGDKKFYDNLMETYREMVSSN